MSWIWRSARRSWASRRSCSGCGSRASSTSRRPVPSSSRRTTSACSTAPCLSIVTAPSAVVRLPGRGRGLLRRGWGDLNQRARSRSAGGRRRERARTRQRRCARRHLRDLPRGTCQRRAGGIAPAHPQGRHPCRDAHRRAGDPRGHLGHAGGAGRARTGLRSRSCIAGNLAMVYGNRCLPATPHDRSRSRPSGAATSGRSGCRLRVRARWRGSHKSPTTKGRPAGRPLRDAAGGRLSRARPR